MPTWLIVLGAILLFLVFVLTLRVRVSATYNKRDGILLKAHILCFSYKLFPRRSRGLTFDLLCLILKMIWAMLPHLRINVSRMHIRVATGDAATTATLYGAVSAALSSLLATLAHLLTLRANTKEMSVYADYTLAKPTADVKLVFSANLVRAVYILLPILLDALRSQKETDEEEPTTSPKIATL